MASFADMMREEQEKIDSPKAKPKAIDNSGGGGKKSTATAPSAPAASSKPAASAKPAPPRRYSTSNDTDDVRLQWMWGDAGVLPLPGFKWAAKVNPFRWSKAAAPDAVADAMSKLKWKKQTRKVKLRIVGQNNTLKFANGRAAAEWVREQCESGDAAAANLRPTEATSGKVSFAAGAAGSLAAPALALWLRVQARDSGRPWRKRNLFVAASYARRVTQVPREVVDMQQHLSKASAEGHPRREIPWDEFDTSRTRVLTAFVEAAATPVADRPASITLDATGEEYQLAAGPAGGNDSPFWVAYVCPAAAGAVLAFRGGDGGVDDAKNHFGSPARAFIAGEDPGAFPVGLQPALDLLEALGRDASVTVIGYSQGGIPALACGLAFGHMPWLNKCILLNAATVFWPPWFSAEEGGNGGSGDGGGGGGGGGRARPLLRDDWWQNPDGIGRAREIILSYIIRDDPLSDGVPGGKMKAPQVPGTTLVLPAVCFGTNIGENHAFKHFVAPLPRMSEAEGAAAEAEEAAAALAALPSPVAEAEKVWLF